MYVNDQSINHQSIYLINCARQHKLNNKRNIKHSDGLPEKQMFI